MNETQKKAHAEKRQTTFSKRKTYLAIFSTFNKVLLLLLFNWVFSFLNWMKFIQMPAPVLPRDKLVITTFYLAMLVDVSLLSHGAIVRFRHRFSGFHVTLLRSLHDPFLLFFVVIIPFISFPLFFRLNGAKTKIEVWVQLHKLSPFLCKFKETLILNHLTAYLQKEPLGT